MSVRVGVRVCERRWRRRRFRRSAAEGDGDDRWGDPVHACARLAATGRRVYAIGDIHGCLDKLVALHALIAADFARRPTGAAVLVHLGDYIDQGPDSAGVLALLSAGPPIAGMPVVNLLGDHERMLLDGLAGDRAAATDWRWAGERRRW